MFLAGGGVVMACGSNENGQLGRESIKESKSSAGEASEKNNEKEGKTFDQSQSEEFTGTSGQYQQGCHMFVTNKFGIGSVQGLADHRIIQVNFLLSLCVCSFKVNERVFSQEIFFF